MALRFVKVRVALMVTIAIGFALHAGAQTPGSPSTAMPDWLRSWTPLNDAGNPVRTLPLDVTSPPELLLPTEKIGLSWTAANPGALPWNVSDRARATLASGGSIDGGLRRPLDPSASSAGRTDAIGWQPLGHSGAVIGRVGIDRRFDDRGSFADKFVPYGSSPLVVTDTTTPAMRLTGATLEGAGGWKLGNWGVGLSAGYDTRVGVTSSSPLPRGGRQVETSGSAGVVRSFRDGRLLLALRGQWSVGAETINIQEVGQEGIVRLLEGYTEVTPVQIQVQFFRRSSTETRLGGIGAEGFAGDLHWVIYADRVTYRERPTSQRQENAATDLWANDGGRGGISFQMPFAGGAFIVTGNGRFATYDGTASEVLPDRSGLRVSEQLAMGELSLRMLSRAGWEGEVTASVDGDRRDPHDPAVGITTHLSGRKSRLNLEVAKRVVPKLRVGGGYSISGYSGATRLQTTSGTGPVFKAFNAPEIDLAGSGLRSQMGTFFAAFSLRSTSSLWVGGRFGRLSNNDAGESAFQSQKRSAKMLWLGLIAIR